ncbi:MAG: hypothetical protein ABSG43_00320 [Solirubrobacteraceae bacterium]|jgi:hypothetical protein
MSDAQEAEELAGWSAGPGGPDVMGAVAIAAGPEHVLPPTEGDAADGWSAPDE